MNNYKPQLHVSMMNMMSRCGVQFQRRYGARFGCWHEEEIIPPSIALAVGSATHKAVQVNLVNKMQSGELLSLEAVQEVAADEFEGIWGGGMLFNDDEAANLNKAKGDAKDQAIGLSSLHHRELAPILNPVAIEEPFVIVLNNYPLDLAGRKDIRENEIIRDTKTAAKTPPDNDFAAKTMQMAMYALSEKVERKSYPKKVIIDTLVKTKTPKIAIREAVPDNQWINPLLKRVERATEIIEAVKSGKRAFSPANPDDWCCTERYCGYATSCPFWSGK